MHMESGASERDMWQIMGDRWVEVTYEPFLIYEQKRALCNFESITIVYNYIELVYLL